MSIEVPSMSSIGSIGIDAGPSISVGSSMSSFEAAPMAPVSISSIAEINGGIDIPSMRSDIFSMPHLGTIEAPQPDIIGTSLNLGEFKSLWEAPKPAIQSEPVTSLDTPKSMVGQSLEDIYASTVPINFDKSPFGETYRPTLDIFADTQAIWLAGIETKTVKHSPIFAIGKTVSEINNTTKPMIEKPSLFEEFKPSRGKGILGSTEEIMNDPIESGEEMAKPELVQSFLKPQNEILPKAFQLDIKQAEKVMGLVQSIGLKSSIQESIGTQITQILEAHLEKPTVEEKTKIEIRKVIQKKVGTIDDDQTPKKRTERIPVVSNEVYYERDREVEKVWKKDAEEAITHVAKEVNLKKGEKIPGRKIVELIPKSEKKKEARSGIIKHEERDDGANEEVKSTIKPINFNSAEQALKTYEKAIKERPPVRKVVIKTTEEVSDKDIKRVLSKPKTWTEELLAA